MRVFNTPFNSPLNSGHIRTETRQRVEVGSGNIRVLGGGRSIDCKNATQKDIDFVQKLYNQLKKEMVEYNKKNKGFFKNAFYYTDKETGEIRTRKSDGKPVKRMIGRDYYDFGKNIRTDFCKAKNNLIRLRNNLKRFNKEAFYEIEYNRLYNNYGRAKALKFQSLNKELVRTITEQREIIDETKSQLPSFKEAWENNKDGVRSRFDTYEDFETEAIAYCRKFPEKCKGGGGTDGSEGGTPGSVSDWRVISDVTTERART
tara:strand:+ start:1534 stop:2310 length:777 start_codon:yes stop_codon:yes gene_type:complete